MADLLVVTIALAGVPAWVGPALLAVGAFGLGALWWSR